MFSLEQENVFPVWNARCEPSGWAASAGPKSHRLVFRNTPDNFWRHVYWLKQQSNADEFAQWAPGPASTHPGKPHKIALAVAAESGGGGARAFAPHAGPTLAYLVEHHQPAASESVLATRISHHRAGRTVFVQTRSKASLRCVQLSLATTPPRAHQSANIARRIYAPKSAMHANCSWRNTPAMEKGWNFSSGLIQKHF